MLLLGIEKKLSTAFYSHTNDQTERQNSTMEVYLRVFVNWEQNNWARLLPIAEFAYNNTINANFGHNLFELNCEFYPQVLFEEDVDPHFRFCLANKLADKLRKLIEICC